MPRYRLPAPCYEPLECHVEPTVSIFERTSINKRRDFSRVFYIPFEPRLLFYDDCASISDQRIFAIVRERLVNEKENEVVNMDIGRYAKDRRGRIVGC